jgi:ABC-2 type transport system ATP-binding protein
MTTTTKPSAIEVRNLEKAYKDVPVLEDVSFTVDQGTVFALLGANGSGKTTTINILTTLIKADGGTASVAGFDVATQPAKVREVISVTGQSAAVDYILTARENLVLMGELRHVADPPGIAAALLDKFGLNDAADRRLLTYSGGMRRRLDIAMSLVG